jgi:hypothetical protein
MKMKRVHQVSRYEPGAVCWTIKPSFWMPALFMHGERCQTLEATQEGCIYRNVEVVEGLFGPLVGLFYGGTVRRALVDVGEGLKAAASA